jgi:branched-chain amino acid transport system permease protein
MAEASATRILLASLHRRARFGFVDVALWGLRGAVLAVVAAGTAGTLIKGRYGLADWLEFLAYGVTMGSIYALIALGYTMVYGVLRLINFAHGDIMMTGAFSGYFLAAYFDETGFLRREPALAMLAVLALGIATSTNIALLTERLAYRPFRRVRGLAPLICAIGVSFFLEQSFRGAFGSGVHAYPDTVWQNETVAVFRFAIPVVQIIVVAIALASMTVLYLIVQRTRMGMAMRAVSEDAEAAAMMGIDVDKVIVFTFALGGAMAGVAGVCYAFVFKQVYFFMGFTPGVKAFGAAVLGGIGSVPGAMLAGLFLGIVESVGPALFLDGIGIPAPYQLRDLIAFTLLIMVLIFRPYGIMGERMAKKRA